MAYVSRQQSTDESNRNRTITGGSVDGGGASGISGQAAGAAAPSSSSGNAVGIRDYIRANQAGADKLAGQVRDVVNKEAGDVRSALSTAQSGFEQKAAQGANTLSDSALNRVQSTGDATGLDKILAGSYSGPRSLTEAGFRGAVDAELQQAKDKAELATTRGGRVQLLREMAGAPQEVGVTRLNEALLGGRNLSGLKSGVQALEGDVLTAEQQAQQRADAIAASNRALGGRAQDALTAYATAKAAEAARVAAAQKAAAEAAARAQAEAQARAAAQAQAEAQARAAAQAEAQRQAAQAEAARQAAAQKVAADAAAAAAAKKAQQQAAWTAPVYESYGGGDSAGEGGGASDGGIGGTDGSGNDGGDSGGDAGTAAGDAGNSGDSGGGGGGGGKIICTMMNDFYGLPYNENKVWIKYAATHLKPEHQKGYHTVFLPLIDFAKKPGYLNTKVRDCLFYIGKHRTIDIQAELAGTYRRPVHKFLRSVIEPTLAFIGRLCK